MWPIFWLPVWFKVFSINFKSSELYLIELLGFLTGLLKDQVKYLALFRLFSVIIASSGSGWEVITRISSYYEGFILGPTLFLLHINDLPDVICNKTIDLKILLSILSVTMHLIYGKN